MIAFFANLFGYVLNFIYNVVKNYGVAIIIFSILVKVLMIPISLKQQKTMKKSAKIQAKMKEIQFKYKNNPEQLNQATMELYKSENMSPFSGCFSAIVQIVLLFAVFYLVRSPLTYMKKIDENVINKYSKIIHENDLSTNSAYPQIEILRELDNVKELKNKKTPVEANEGNESSEEQQQVDEKIKDLSEINDEELNNLYINMDFLGLDLAQVPTKSSDWKAYIIPILYVITAVISLRVANSTQLKDKKVSKEEQEENKDEKALTKPEDDFDPMAQMNKNMNMMFPVMYLAVALIAPLGLALYWLMNSLLMIIEKLILNKLLKDEEEN
ncbi:MAG: YidC/Oxa1 family membrane protein insertase [Clostridia bacterium]